MIYDNLSRVGFNEKLINESKNWSQATKRQFDVKKDDILCIPPQGYNDILLGAGWDTKIDVDLSIIIFD